MHQEPTRPVIEGPTVAHLGVGAFHRAHQAWYVHRSSLAAARWGIVAFTGRSARQAQLLQARGGQYTLVSRAAGGDEIEQIASIRSAHDGAERDAWERTLAHQETQVVTITVTEAGYCRDSRGRLDVRDAVVAADLRHALQGADAPIVTAPVRLALGLAARRAVQGAGLTVISCDNLSGNGEVTRAVVLDAAAMLDPGLPGWIDENVVFRSSMVDRITPRTTQADIDEVERLTGIRDEGTVVAEPFSEWVIEDGFAGARPDWEVAGVRHTTDLAPFEERKLRILNGAHSLLAYHGLLRGFEDVATAFADPELRALVEQYWEVAAASCVLPVADLESAIEGTRTRFANPRIRHHLAQIAQDGALKLPQRIVPVLAYAVRAGVSAHAPASAIAAWCAQTGVGLTDAAPLLFGAPGEGMGPDPAVSKQMLAVIARELRRLESAPDAAGWFAGAAKG